MADLAYSSGSPSPFHAPSEEVEDETVKRLKNGDEEALDEVLKLYWSTLLRYAQRILPDGDQAEDVVQEAFVKLWDRRGTWRLKRSLRPVLFRIVRNAALNEKRRTTTFNDWAERFPGSEKDPDPSPLEEAEGSDMRAIVREAVDSLPERRREIFLLVRFHHLSYRETAETLGIQPQVVANQVSRALKDLREKLSPHLEEEDSPGQIPLPSRMTG